MNTALSGSMILDLAIAFILLVRLLAGLREGIVVSVLSLIGTILGACVGIWGTPYLLFILPGLTETRLRQTIGVAIFILLCIGLGTTLLRRLGYRLRGGKRARGIDALIGGIASLLIAALICSGLLTAVRPISPTSFGRAIDRSYIYNGLMRVVPDQFNSWPVEAMEEIVHILPDPFKGATPDLPIDKPESSTVDLAAVRAAQRSVVKIMASTPACSSDSSGSGWVIAPEKVVTNAHVVAGSLGVQVKASGDFLSRPAMVVAYDPHLDLAVLSVPGLKAPAMRRQADISPGDDVVAAGYPWGGGFRLTPARLRGTIDAESDDIYGRERVIRQVHAVRGTIKPGNSGGPLLNTRGEVVGTIFARASDEPETGYALTDAASADLLDHVDEMSTVVPTGACAQR